MSTEVQEVPTVQPFCKIAEALSKAQGQFAHISRDKTVTVQTTKGGTYKFSYAPLETIMAAVRPALAANGLAMTQVVSKQSDGEYVRTLLMHPSGESMSCDIPLLTKEPGPQAYGSALTYARRYGITLLLCVVADDDDDGNGAEGNSVSNGQSGGKSKHTFGNGSSGKASAQPSNDEPAEKPVPPQPSDSEKNIDTISIQPGQATNLHVSFKEALRVPLKPKADTLLSDFLAHEGYIDADLKPTAMKIPSHLFFEVRDAAIKHAKSL